MAQTYYTTKWADDYNRKLKSKNLLQTVGNVLAAPVSGTWALLKDSAGVKPPTTTPEPITSTSSTNLEPVDYDSILGQFGTSSSSSTGGGGGMIDLSNILSSYEQGAESNRNVARQTYETSRNDLLTSLKRFQEQNAKDVANQQRAYLANQASLESAIAQADRQNRISAAARGLGGSGLQQLAQLQNLLSQGQTISNMATENQSAMDNLRTLLRNTEEDTGTKLANALATYNNALSTINSNLAMNKANIEYQARENAANRAANASNYAAAQEQANNERISRVSQLLSMNQEQLSDALRTIANTNPKKLEKLVNPYSSDNQKYGTNDVNTIKQALYDAARSQARSILADANVSTDAPITSTALNNLSAILNSYR